MKIVNIVATAKVKGTFDLTLLLKRVKAAEFSQGHWLKLRIQPEDYYVAFYRSGKFLITSLKDYTLINSVVHRVLSISKQAGVNSELE